MTPSISIFSSDKTELNKLSNLFAKEGFEAFTFSEVDQITINKVFSVNSDILLLNLDLENSDGIDLCYQLKKEKEIDAFVVLMAGQDEDYIQVEAFKAGADDYIVKPINPRVLVKRINALIKRKQPNNKSSKPKLISRNDVEVDRESYKVIKANQEIVLPRKEFEILYLLIQRPNKVFSREEIFSTVWKDKPIKNTRIIDVHIRKIRERVGSDTIKTIKGVGYHFA